MQVDTTIAKWGHSLAVRIPAAILKEARLAEGDHLSLRIGNKGAIVMRPAKRRYDLKQLLSAVNARNRHDEVSWGQPSGRELW